MKEQFDTLWVVEIRNRLERRWESTAYVGCARQMARQELAEAKDNNPSDRFRLVRYKRT